MRKRTNTKLLLVVLAAVLGIAGAAVAAEQILYFTAGNVPTSGERAAIATLRAQAARPYTVRVLSAVKAGARAVETTDYTMGTLPPNYRDGGTDSGGPTFPTYSITTPPTSPTLPTGQATFTTGGYVHITNVAGVPSVQLTISGNAVTAAVYRGPDAGI